MNYVFIVIAFVFCSFVGYLFASKYKKRKNFFSSLIALLDKLSLDISFSRERLKVMFENFDTANKKKLLGVMEEYILFLEKKKDLSKEDLFAKASVLKEDEKDLIFLFLKTLGRSDVENQTKEISNFASRFDQSRKKCEEENKKFGTLSLKLGMIAGLFFAVILL